ncbi:hypothetical protein PMAYCL1PPCAC_20524, partial [Pristionchus mayeri]
IQMRPLFAALALVTCTLAYKDEMLSSNRIAEVKPLQTACGECKSVVHSIMAAIDDPQKLAELKVLLNVLCLASSFPVECKMVVSTIEVFIKRLEPYLRDEEAICKKMHLCANAKLENFHRIGMIYLKHAKIDEKQNATNEFMCDECQMAVVEIKKVVDGEQGRADIKDMLENMCKYVPKYWEACEKMVDDYLPKVWKYLDDFLADPKQACAQIGFCAKQDDLPVNKIATFYSSLKAI